MLHAHFLKIKSISIRALFVVALLSCLTAIVMIGYIYVVQEQISKNVIYPGIHINNKDFSGRSPDDVKAYFKNETDMFQHYSFEFTFEEESIATFSGKQMHIQYNGEEIARKAFLQGREIKSLDGIIAFLQLNVLKQRRDLYVSPDYSIDEVQIFLENFAADHSKEPQDALFEVNNGRASAFRVDEPGYSIPIDSALHTVKEHIQTISVSTKNTYKIPLTKKMKEAKIRLADINSFGIVEKIGSGKSDYTGSSAERKHNLLLAAQKMHGILIPPEGIFSYNQALGDVSRATGYKQGYIIKEGKTVLGDGGGICQISTTLFRAALNTGLPIIKRKAHAYRVHYYENDQKPGLDATVYAPSVDFQFKNDTGTHILIQTIIDQEKRTVVLDFYGKKDGRVVTLSPIKIWDIQKPPDPVYVDDPTLPRGTQKQTEHAALGTKSSFTYLVKRGDETLQDRTFLSVYRSWGAVFLVGTKD